MAAAAELPRPGVEVIQEFRSVSPTVLRPTLVPLVVGAAKEIVEVTTADGLLNAAAKQGSYEQLPRIIPQTSFPSPRENIDEVDVEEDTIRVYFQFGGSLRELERNPGESFLASVNKASRPAVRTEAFSTSAGLALDGKVLVLAVDIAARINVTRDIPVKFAAVEGGNLTAEQIADQINNAVGEDVAEVIVEDSNSRVQIASLLWGASASITVRKGGSANALLGFDDDAEIEYRVEGSGFRAQDQSNNTTLSPWIEWSKGVYQLDPGGVQNAVAEAEGGAQFGFLDANGDFQNSYQASTTAFTGVGSLSLKVGDEFFADGELPNGAVVMKVEPSRFKLGTVNLKLSVYDDNGRLVSAVYDESKVATLFSRAPFAPRYGWFMAKNLTVSQVATAATLTGSSVGNEAETATLTASAVSTYPLLLAGLTLNVDVTIDGEEQETVTVTFTGGAFADVGAVVTAINAMETPGFFAHPDEETGTMLCLSTDKTGVRQSITLLDSSTALTELHLTADTASGKDTELVNVTASVVSGTNQAFPFTLGGVGETLVIERTADGGATWTAGTKTFTFASAGPFADIAALLAALNTAGGWNGGTLPTEFVISNVGNKLKIASTGAGALVGVRVGVSSTALGATANSDLLLTSGGGDVGEAELNNQTLKFKLNDRSKVYQVLFTSNSLQDAVESINETVGWPMASVDGDETSLVLTSSLKGAASKIEVVSDTTSAKAVAALGFGTGNNTAAGSGRPSPDFYLDVSGNVVLGAEVLRSLLSGEPFSPGSSDIYIQYRGLRKDVSAMAKEPGMLRISTVEDLQTLLSPIRSDNPLALGMFFEIINAPGLECGGLGVDEVSAGAPYGTLVAFTRAANLIEAEEVYAIAPLTDDEMVHQVFKAHVEAMSSPEQKGERIVIVCPKSPTRAVDDVIASGLSGNSTASENEFVVDDNPLPGLTSRRLEPLELTYDDQVFLEMTVDGEQRRYLVTVANGTLLQVTQEFGEDENADGFFSVAPLNETVINGDWSLKVRGDELFIPGSTLLDKNRVADTVAAKAAAYNQRRFIYVFPDQVTATIGNVEELLPGFFSCAAIAGMIARFPPQQGFTNMPMTGFTGVVGSNDRFSVKQLNRMAGGGTYILVQEAPGAPLTSRHQLTTNLTSVETRELSITKVVDFVAKFMRVGLRRFIGTFNITQPFLDTLSTVIQGILGFLTESGVILGGDLNNLMQDQLAPDTVLVDVTLDVPFPCNYIRLTLVI